MRFQRINILASSLELKGIHYHRENRIIRHSQNSKENKWLNKKIAVRDLSTSIYIETKSDKIWFKEWNLKKEII